MADEPEVELTREGLFEELVGKTKEAAGELIGNDALAQAGRDQQAEAEAKSASTADDDTEGGG